MGKVYQRDGEPSWIAAREQLPSQVLEASVSRWFFRSFGASSLPSFPPRACAGAAFAAPRLPGVTAILRNPIWGNGASRASALGPPPLRIWRQVYTLRNMVGVPCSGRLNGEYGAFLSSNS